MQNILFYSENCGFCQAFFAESAIFPGKYRGKCLALLLGPPACKNVLLIQQASHAGKLFAKAAGRLEEAELLELKGAYEAQIAKKFPVPAQLRRQQAAGREDENVFRV